MNWSRIWRDLRGQALVVAALPFAFVRELKWKALIVGPIALAIIVGVSWVVGLLAALILDPLFGWDIIGYHGSETAHTDDHLRYVIVGFGLLIGGWSLQGIWFTVEDEWSSWSQAKRKLKEERARGQKY